MKQYSYVIVLLLIAGLWFAQRFIVDPGARDPGPRNREELSALPGGVAYPEGTSTVPELFQEAKALLEKSDLVQAEKVYRKIVATEPNNVPGYIGVGSCRFWQEDLQGAENQYQKALTLDPRSSQALLGLAAVFSRRGKYETAVDYYQRVLAVDANLADAHFGLANSQYQLKNQEQALRHYQRCLELAPKSNMVESARAKIAELQEIGRKP